MRSVNRRDIFPALGATALAGLAAAGLAKPETLTAAPAAKPEGKNPDARLIALCDEFCRLERKSEALFEGPTRIDDDDERTPHVIAVMNEQDPVLDGIVSIKATTLAGLKAKTEALVAWDKWDSTLNRKSHLRADVMLCDLVQNLLAVSALG